ncbi:MAG: DUF4145 domain-containing protein [Chloroflexi bacterium]|nr:DUF4145 domain-containing protein [Chloroflexota bacterium]
MAPPTNDLVIPVWPFLNDRPLCPPEVPPHIAEDYQEACLVLIISPKASAALSRRCLQNLLHDAAKVKPSNLFTEIQDVINSGQLPSHIEEAVHAIRQIGNFAAHPLKSESTGEILPVEHGEAEWNLDTLVNLFDFYYVKPKKNAQMLEDLNTKSQDVEKYSRK